MHDAASMTENPRDASSDERHLSLDEALAEAKDHLRTGRLKHAEILCQNILAVAPAHAPTLHLYGVIAHAVGNLPAAIDLFSRAVAADGGVAQFQADLAETYRLAGRLEEALAFGCGALALAPDDARLLNNLGIVHYERRAFEEAAAFFERAIEREPGFAEAHCNLGNTLWARGRADEGAAAYRKAIALKPSYAAAFNNLGTALRDLGRLEEAEAAYRAAFALNPDDPMVLDNLALALRDLERLDEASALLDASLSLAPENGRALTHVALLRLDQNRVEEAHEAARRAVALLPGDPETLNAMGLSLQELGRVEEALGFYRRAIASKPDFAGAYNNIGNVLKQEGRLAEAHDAYARSLAIDPRQAEVYVNLADTRKVEPDDAWLASMEGFAREMESLRPTTRMRLHFALAKAHDDLGDHDLAFHHMHEANALKRAQIAYDEAASLKLFDHIRETFDAKLIEAKSGGGDLDAAPIFILGMPRSGSTLVEQILASHPLVHGAGELPHLGEIVGGLRAQGDAALAFPEIAQAMGPEDFGKLGREYVARLRRYSTTAAHITDKMPSNFCFIGLIHLALPNARIVHVTRDPLDTCLSCFSRLFSAEQNHTYDLAELGRFYRKYAELMAHWRKALPEERMLELRYEDVVGDLEGSARRMIAYCGLDWSESCLAFHETNRPVKTASASQVRRPIYKTAQNRSRHYREHLAPLIAELGDLAGPVG
jgi:tetratricopeptide (TPR) repeat protein